MLQSLRLSLRTAFDVTARRGFTLIEIAIVLVVIGLIVSGGLLAVSPVLKSAKINETKQKMATVEAALLGYVIANGCLPCPALRGATATGVSNTNNAVADDYATPCGSGGSCTAGGNGLVPWTTLGIAENEATDGWNRRMTFAVDPTLTDSATDVQRSSTGTFPTFTSGINMANTTGGALSYTQVAYVLISHGPDMAYGEAANGTLGDSTNVTDLGTIENGDADVTYATGAPTSTFDDLVSFKSLRPLIISCGTGSCGNPS